MANPDRAKAISVRQQEKLKLGRNRRNPKPTLEELAARRALRAPLYNSNRRAKYHGDAQYRRERLDRVSAKKFGITAEEYAALRTKPCAICGRHVSPGGRNQGMHVDHCHATGRIRGTLCPTCNLGLGKFKDDLRNLERAADYLREA